MVRLPQMSCTAHQWQRGSAGGAEAGGAGERGQRREHEPTAVQRELVVAPVQREVHLRCA